MIKSVRILLVLVLLGAGLETVAAVPAGAATGPGGTFVALPTPSRVASARTVKAGRTITVRVAGVGSVPRSGAASVVVTVTVSGATATGGLTVFGGHRPGTTNLQFRPGAAATDSVLVPLSAGRIHLRNAARRGSVQIAVDVSGYYRAGTAPASDPGIVHVLPVARRLGTVTIRAHGAVSLAAGGHAGLPAEPGAAAVTLTVAAPAASGTLLAHRPDEPALTLPVARFAAHRSVSSFAVLRVVGGRTVLANTGSRAVRVSVDVAAWYGIGFAQTAGAFQTLVPTRISSGRLGAGRTAAVPVAGRGGVPLSGVTAVLAVLHVVSPARAGGVQAWRYGAHRPRAATVLQFAARQAVSNEVLIPVSANGRLDLRNSSRGTLTFAVDVHGYVPATTLTPPTGGATARYLPKLVDSPTANATAMTAAGQADAAAGNTFVLLDIGAQANDKSGVVLSATTTKISYTNLVAAIRAYLDGFTTAGHTGTVAVGTNNSGNDWTTYPAAARGADWATKVVVPLATYAVAKHVPVIGATDLEDGFFSTEPQAEAWKSAFLAGVPGTSTALVYNGSADFCPKTWTRYAACNFGWTYQKLYALAGGSRTVVLPQVYLGYMATEWAMINSTGGGHLRFLGTLTEHALNGGTLTAAQGWVALQRAMSSVTRTGIGGRAADIHE